MEICIDFDGTCVTHEFPKVGKDIGAAKVLKRLVNSGNKLILFTMRSDIECPESSNPDIHAFGGNYLSDAVNWFKENDITLFGINQNPNQVSWTHSPKAYAQMYIDDAALGCPITADKSLSKRPFVDWKRVELILESYGLFKQ